MGNELKNFRTADELVARLSAELDSAKKRKADAERVLIDRMTETGQVSVKMADGYMVSMSTKVRANRASGVDADTLAAALIDAGYGELVTSSVHAQRLQSFCKEHIVEDPETLEPVLELPESVAKCISLFEQHTVSVRGRKVSAAV